MWKVFGYDENANTLAEYFIPNVFLKLLRRLLLETWYNISPLMTLIYFDTLKDIEPMLLSCI